VRVALFGAGGKVGSVLAPVVLDHQLQPRVGQVEPVPQPPVGVVDLVVHDRLRQPGEHDQHPQPGLHRRVHLRADVPSGPQRRGGVVVCRPAARIHELPRGDLAEPHQRVTDDHEVDEREHTSELDEHAERVGHAEPAHRRHRGLTCRDVVADLPAMAPVGGPVNGDVGEGVGRDG